MARIYRDTYGHAITVDTKVSLASATAQEIHVKKPKTGTTVEWTGAVSGNNITYTSVSGDFNETGTYLCCAYFTESGKVFIGEPFEIKVYDKWEK
jgi:hypothetical protein